MNGSFVMLAIKQAAGNWLLAGDQRQVGVSVQPSVRQFIPIVGTPSYNTTLNFNPDCSLEKQQSHFGDDL